MALQTRDPPLPAIEPDAYGGVLACVDLARQDPNVHQVRLEKSELKRTSGTFGELKRTSCTFGEVRIQTYIMYVWRTLIAAGGGGERDMSIVFAPQHPTNYRQRRFRRLNELSNLE